jgi:hypothetical protein
MYYFTWAFVAFVGWLFYANLDAATGATTWAEVAQPGWLLAIFIMAGIVAIPISRELKE